MTNTPTPDYNITITPTMKIMLREAAEQGARAAISEIMKSGMNLDKTKQTNEERPLSERDNDMARIKQRVTLPTGEAIWCTGESIGDMLSNLLSRLSMNPPAAKKPAPTLRAFVDTVYRPNFINGLAATTCANYETYLAQYILPFMGDMRMDEITVGTMQAFYDWMALGRERTLNCKSIDRVGGLAGRIFAVAKAQRLIGDTPYQKILLRNKGRKAGHHKSLPDEEVDRIKRAIPTLEDERQRLYMGLLVYTGMRREEILGVRWETINLQAGYGEIEKVVVYPANRVATVKDNPKTETSERIFIIPRPLREILEPCKRESGFVIHGRTPEEPAAHKTMQRTYTRAFRLLGINGRFDNHDWRATYAIQLKDAGLTSAQGADVMGHADTRMFDTVYAPARKQSILKHKDAVEKINAAYVCDTQ